MFSKGLRISVLLAVLTAMVAIACSSEPTSAPAAPATPIPAAAPTAAPATAPTAVTSAPTPTQVVGQATPTRVPPTATPAVTGQPRYGGTVRFVNEGISSLDPNYSRLFVDRDVMFGIYDSLVTVLPDFSYAPGLAKSWEVSSDGKAVTFKLQEGVKFHDGSEFTADVMRKNFQYTMNPNLTSVIRPILNAYLSDVEVVDKYTAVLRLKAPYRPLLSDLGTRDGQSLTISAAAVEKLGGGVNGDFGRKSVGTGPFRFVEWTPGSRVVIERNPNYWRTGRPYLDRLMWFDTPDYSVQLAMVRTGEADIMISVRPDDLPTLRRSSDIAIDEHKSGRFYAIFFSTDKAPWNNQKLRAAVAYAINRQVIANVLWNGAARPAYMPEGSGWAFNPDIKTYEFSVAKSKEMLATAGYPNGITVSYHCEGTSKTVQECETIQSMLGAAGIKANIELVPAGEAFTRHIAGTVTMLDTFYSPRPDPHGRISRVFLSNGAGNPSKHSIPGLDDKINQAATVYDVAKAKPLYDEIQRIIAEDARVVFKVHSNEYAALSAKMRGYVRYGDLNSRWTDIWLSQ